MSADAASSRLTELQNEVLRRVGRNLLLLQQIELLMKFLLANATIETGPEGLLPAQLERQAGIRKSSLGQIRKQFFEEIFSAPPEYDDDKPVAEFRARSSFRISPGDTNQLLGDQSKFEEMTAERNDLVHHFLERFRLSEESSLQDALLHLDAQRERALPLHEYLKRLHDGLIEGRRTLATFFESPEGRAAMDLMRLQSSRIVSLLLQAAELHSRSDGWTVVSSAANYIAAQDPDQLRSIKRNFGLNGLQSLVEASQLFDLCFEATAKEGRRAIYRVRPEADPA